VGHLQSWLRFVAPTLFTIIYIKKISQCVNQCRDILLAYLIVLTGVGPLDGLPSCLSRSYSVLPQFRLISSSIHTHCFLTSYSFILPQSILNSHPLLPQFLLMSYSILPQFLLSSYSIPPQVLLGSYSIPPQFLLGSYSIPPQFLLSSYSIPPQFLLIYLGPLASA
jgi:hypothetical protein